MIGSSHHTGFLKNMQIHDNEFSFLNVISSFFILVIIFGFSIPMLSSNHIVLASSSDKKVALIRPSFTWAAYNFDSFYNFYAKYSPAQYAAKGANVTITENTHLLKDRPIPEGAFTYYLDVYEEPYIPYINFINLASDLYKEHNIIAANLTDVDVHQGKIFNANGTNAYDVLFLFHNEYVTQAEYDNLKKFVFNGGTIVFGDGNVLYAQVAYNENTNSITLVSGHNWNFDNKSTAYKGPAEKWIDETREWVGSNFLDIPSNFPLRFNNNPFNYTHAEENYVANPNAKILIDYKLDNVPRSSGQYLGATVATYEMDYGKGKIIHLGLWGHMLAENKEFIKYLNSTIIPLSINSTS